MRNEQSMKRRGRGDTAAMVVAAFDKNPKITSTELGERLGLNPAYVRKALQRNGRRLFRAPRWSI